MKIEVIKKFNKNEVEKKNIRNWPIWEKEPSSFDWHYECGEVCYVLKGKAVIKTIYQEVEIEEGDYVVFPAGMRCHWNIKEKFKKHYNFEKENI